LPALLEAIEALNCFLVGQQVDAGSLHTVRLAIEEMGTNIIKYGYSAHGEHWITLRAQLESKVIELRLLDAGRPFDPTAAPEPDSAASLDERTPGGWGISLVRKLVTEMIYQRVNEQNVLTLRLPR
jgi:anti-sigma regulatory factor (Ser/Thr protein kinase)